jgi:uncharacterized protein YukE
VNTVVSGGLPTLTQIRGWRTEHLRSAAERWSAAAQTWTAVYDEITAGVQAPSGTPWEGEASAAARDRVGDDRDRVTQMSDRLHRAARAARSGHQAVEDARRAALLAVDVATVMGYDVREDLSVVGRRPGHTLQAELLGLGLRVAAAQLAAADQRVAGELADLLAPLAEPH